MVKAIHEKSDSELWDEFLSGDQLAFKTIYDNHIQSLFKFGRHFTKSEELILDCIHDVFIDLYNYRTTLNSTNNIKLYLFVSLRRKLFRNLKDKERFVSLDDESSCFSYVLNSSTEPEDDLKSLKISWLEKSMNKLSHRQQEAIYLRFVKGLSYDELSVILQVNYQSARNLIFRGIEKLRENGNEELIYLLLFVRRIDNQFFESL